MPRRARHPGLRRAAALGILAALPAFAGAAPAQELPIRLGAGEEPPAAEDAGRPPRLSPPRISLLREGSYLLEVAGRVLRDDTRGTWHFIIDADDPEDPSHDLTILPSTLLAEMERMIESADGRELVFELTGRVYVYRDRNYFMPTHTPILVSGKRPEAPVEPRPPRANPDEIEGRSAEDIIRSLRRDTGPLPSRPAAPEGDLSPIANQSLVSEGTILFGRRGKVRRTGGGALVFILDADAEGLEDPSMILLPCLLIERLEQYAHAAGERAAILLNGQVYAYRGRNFLLPTLYQIPLDRTRMNP